MNSKENPMKRQYALTVTTQGPLYPPSEVWDQEGNFIVIGMINRQLSDNQITPTWGAAIVSPQSELPHFGSLAKYDIVSELDLTDLGEYGDKPLYTLPLPLPCNNYDMHFAPQQKADSKDIIRASLPLHDAVPDFEFEHSRQNSQPITLNQWVKAEGNLTVEILNNQHDAKFSTRFKHLISNSLYTVMALRENDLDPLNPTRPGPLGVPHCFVSDEYGDATFKSIMQNPFPEKGGNRIINIVVLYMSSQCSNGGAIGLYGLGGDIHAQLKLTAASFQEFNTK